MKWTILLSVILTTAPKISSAQSVFGLPDGKNFNVGTATNPDWRRCYTLDEFKEVLKLALTCRFCEETVDNLQKKVDEDLSKIDKLNKIITLKDDILKITTDQRDRLSGLYQTELQKRITAEQRPNWGWKILVSFLAVSTLTFAGLAAL